MIVVVLGSKNALEYDAIEFFLIGTWRTTCGTSVGIVVVDGF